MRKIIKCTFLLFLFFFLTKMINAQQQYPLPEFKNTINQIDTVKLNLKDLEKINAEIDIKIKGFGYGGSESYLKLSGIKSTVDFQISEAVFIIKLPDAETDPSTYVELYKFESDKDRRKVKLSSRKLSGRSKNVDIHKLELIFKKITPGNYLITVPKELVAGNYGFVIDPSSISSGFTLGSKSSAIVFAFDLN